jgi:selenocysteine-specific elongation factor
MALIIGTAGHIDHGKTALVRTLTGQDTDRLPEEKARGISIDLGFAWLDLPDGTRAGIVDVPGHERFIRNMLAGAHGIDLVLFTVAADDGVMPQTEEHLDIVELLGVSRAITVVTKADLVSPERLDEVNAEIAALAAGTLLAHAPVVRTSVVSGRGLDDLRRAIATVAATVPARPPGGRFRLPVDRAFALPGHGLVVTGTARAGEVRGGDRVRCLPGGQLLRVRSVEVHNAPVDAASAGQRVALNLSAHEAVAVERGHVICDESIAATTTRFDAHLRTVKLARDAALRHQQRVRVHVGTAERLGRIVLLGEHALGSCAEGYGQIVLAEPVLVMRGDRFIVRDETARQTIGGGIVIHPQARAHRRTEAGLTAWLERLHRGTQADVVAALVERMPDRAATVHAIEDLLDVAPGSIDIGSVSGLHRLSLDDDRLCVTDANWQAMRTALREALGAFHLAQALAPGMEMEEARAQVAADLTPRVFRALVEQFAAEGLVSRDGSLLRLPTHAVRLTTGEETLAVKLAALLGASPWSPPDLAQLTAESGAARNAVVEMLRVMERGGTVVRASPEVYFLRDAVERVKATLRARLPPRGTVTPAACRDLFQTSRKYAIPLLELLDREGLTIRIGETRRLR